jgi:cyclopropane fatty-acyl-phospholipid synthase-like methyltransferase
MTPANSTPAAAREQPTRADVRRYWDESHDTYLAHVGTVFQAGRITSGTSMRESNVWLAGAAGIAPAQRVLDAGCGMCGPAVDIASHVPGVQIVGLTVSRRQAVAAAALIAQSGLSGRVHVVHADYHRPPFPDRSFDVVLFFESIGYADDLGRLFPAIRRVLRPGGRLYVKDVFRRERLWSDQERDELEEFDRAFVQRTPALADCAEAARVSGFADVRTRDLSRMVTTAHAWRAMFDSRGRPTAFGRLHHGPHSCLPVYFAELTGRAPLE